MDGMVQLIEVVEVPETEDLSIDWQTTFEILLRTVLCTLSPDPFTQIKRFLAVIRKSSRAWRRTERGCQP